MLNMSGILAVSKFCKDCIHFNNLWNECTYAVTYKYKYNNISGANDKIRVGNYIKIKEMRSEKGACGVNAKYFYSNTKATLIMILFFSGAVLMTLFLLFLLVNFLDSL